MNRDALSFPATATASRRRLRWAITLHAVPVDIKPGDFSHAAELIEQSYLSTVSRLRHGADRRSLNPPADHDDDGHR